MKKYEVFLFDADNKLYDYDKAKEYAFTDNAIAVAYKDRERLFPFTLQVKTAGVLL